jgi:hypothetical protein
MGETFAAMQVPGHGTCDVTNKLSKTRENRRD